MSGTRSWEERLWHAQQIIEAAPRAPAGWTPPALGLIQQVASAAPGTFGNVATIGDDADRGSVYLLAGALACQPCEHLLPGEAFAPTATAAKQDEDAAPADGGVTVAVLALRRVVCADCWSRGLGDTTPSGLHLPPQPVVAENCCDLCGQVAPSGRFTPVLAAVGHLAVHGDLCRDCMDIVAGPRPGVGCRGCESGERVAFTVAPYESPGGHHGIQAAVVGLQVTHDEDCPWFLERQHYRRRAGNRAARRAAIRRARRGRDG